MAERPLHVATVIPPFGPGSGGHGTIFKLLAQLERRGHTCSVWVHDPRGLQPGGAPSVRRRIVEGFVPLAAPVHLGFDDWSGADVVMATSWDTVFPSVLLPGCRARAYLIQDHEPDFLPTSAESSWCAGTYGLGLYGISAGRWLHDLVDEPLRPAGHLVPPGRGPLRLPTPSRGAPARHRRVLRARGHRPAGGAARSPRAGGAEAPPARTCASCSSARRIPYPLSFEHEYLGVVGPAVLARHYSAATAGLCLSLTNWSLVPQEMLACGLPCVDLAGGSTETEAGDSGAMCFAEPDPSALASALEGLLDDERAWAERSRAGHRVRAVGVLGAGRHSGGARAARGAAGARGERLASTRNGLDPSEGPSAELSPPWGLHHAKGRPADGRQRHGTEEARYIPVPGAEVSALPVELNHVSSAGEPHVTRVDPARRARELLLGGARGLPVDGDGHAAADRSRDPNPVPARPADGDAHLDSPRADRLHQ